METELKNTVSATGTYNNIPTEITSDVVLVTMLSGLTITKTADKTIWADDYLTYTITITNNTSQTYATPIVKDVVDTNLVTFVNESVTMDGAKAETSEYSFEGNTLTINLKDLAPNGTSTITFQVAKKTE